MPHHLLILMILRHPLLFNITNKITKKYAFFYMKLNLNFILAKPSAKSSCVMITMLLKTRSENDRRI